MRSAPVPPFGGELRGHRYRLESRGRRGLQLATPVVRKLDLLRRLLFGLPFASRLLAHAGQPIRLGGIRHDVQARRSTAGESPLNRRANFVGFRDKLAIGPKACCHLVVTDRTQLCAHGMVVPQQLSVADHPPPLVVVHDGDERDLVADGRVELRDVEPGRAITYHGEDAPLRVRHLRCETKRQPDAEAATLQQQQIRLDSSRIEALTTPGLVSITATLTRAKAQ